MMRWPARIRPGRVVSEPITTLDIFPTLVALTGATLPSRHYDGQDVSRLITGEVDRIPGLGTDGGRELVFWQEGGKPGALRSGRYKYLRPGFWNTSPTLFDLETDPARAQRPQQDASGAREPAREAAPGDPRWRAEAERAGGRRRLAGSVALAAASVVVTLLALEAAFRLVGVSVGTVQINRETVRRSDDPLLRFELRPRRRRPRGGRLQDQRARAARSRDDARQARRREARGRPRRLDRVRLLGRREGRLPAPARGDARPRAARASRSSTSACRATTSTRRSRPCARRPSSSRPTSSSSPSASTTSRVSSPTSSGSCRTAPAARGRSSAARARRCCGRSLLFSWIEYRFSELEARRQLRPGAEPAGRAGGRRGGGAAGDGARRQARGSCARCSRRAASRASSSSSR